MDKDNSRNPAPTVVIGSVDHHHAAQLAQTLQALSFQPCRVADGNQVYARSAGLSQPDLVLMDVSLPGLDGMATCRLLRDTASTAHIPVMLFGTSASLEHRLLAFQAGAVDYLRKPCDPAELLARIQARRPPRGDGDDRRNGLHNEDTSEDELLVQMTMWYLEEHQALPPPCKLLARRMGVSEARLARAFNNVHGKSPKAAFLDARLSKARHLLTERRLSVAEVAGSLGYANTAGFSTAFRLRWGQSPIAYRTQAAGRMDRKRIAITTRTGDTRVVLAMGTQQLHAGIATPQAGVPRTDT